MKRGVSALLLLAGVFGAAGPARADCALLPFNSVQPIVERFLFQRDSLLRDYPRGGEQMRIVVSIIGMSSKAALPEIMRVAKAANTDQRQAIGAGLGLAAQRCKTAEPSAARRIEAAMKSFVDPVMTKEFATTYRSPDAARLEREAQQRAQLLRDQISAPPGNNADKRLGRINPDRVAPIQPLQPLSGIAPIAPVR